jgi:hypothetical protein
MTFLGRYNNQGRILPTFTWIIFFTFSLSANAYALPIQFDISRVINLSIMDGRGARSGEDLNSPPGNGSGGSHLLYGLPDLPAGGPPQGSFIPLSTLPSITSSMPFASGLPGLDGEAQIFEPLDENTGDTADIRRSEWYTGFDAEAMADFLAGVDFLTTDWQADLGQSPVATHETPAPPTTEVIRRNPRECLQGNHGPKRGVQESLCIDSSGLGSSGVRSPGGGSSSSSAAFRAGAGGAIGNSRNVIGAADGIGGGGGGAGGAGGGAAGGSNNSGGNGSVENNSGGGTGNNGAGNEGGDKGDGSPGSSSGTGNGGGIGQGGGAGAETGDGTWDQGGNSGSGGGGAAEVRPVPEPVSLALIALGFAGMCFVRSHQQSARCKLQND